MLSFMIRRFLLGASTLVGLSVIVFIIVQLPEGDYLDVYKDLLAEQTGDENSVSPKEIEALRKFWGLDQPLYIQYGKWFWNLVRLDFGWSLEQHRPVIDVIGERLPLTVVLAVTTVIFTWLLAIPIGVYSAVRQHSVGDYTVTFVGFIGLAVPDFLFALALMYFAFQFFDLSIGGLFSPQYLDVGWSWGRVVDLTTHLWIPAIVLGTSGTASLIRIMRANLLDELEKPYVVTARAKGVTEWKLLIKYPVRVALNPFISTIGYVLPYLLSGSVIVSVVLSLPTLGPMLLRALLQQDVIFAGTVMMMLATMTVIGTLISDILLVISDPRIKFAGK